MCECCQPSVGQTQRRLFVCRLPETDPERAHRQTWCERQLTVTSNAARSGTATHRRLAGWQSTRPLKACWGFPARVAAKRQMQAFTDRSYQPSALVAARVWLGLVLVRLHCTPGAKRISTCCPGASETGCAVPVPDVGPCVATTSGGNAAASAGGCLRGQPFTGVTGRVAKPLGEDAVAVADTPLGPPVVSCPQPVSRSTVTKASATSTSTASDTKSRCPRLWSGSKRRRTWCLPSAGVHW
jgi:hypothetical protein